MWGGCLSCPAGLLIINLTDGTCDVHPTPLGRDLLAGAVIKRDCYKVSRGKRDRLSEPEPGLIYEKEPAGSCCAQARPGWDLSIASAGRLRRRACLSSRGLDFRNVFPGDAWCSNARWGRPE